MIFNKESIKTVDNVAGIYLIKNKINGKCYIGQSIRLRKRLLHHLNNYINNRYDFPLYRAFDKYGTDNFEVFILDSFNSTNYTEIKKELDILEIKYIKEYNSYGTTGYNQTYGGDAGVLGYKMTEEQKDKIKNNTKSTNEDGRYLVYCFDVLDKVYYTFINRAKLSEYLKCCLNRGKKYSLKRSSYQKYKQRFIPQYHREYTRLVNLASFISYAKSHSIKECAKYFNIKERRAYKYKQEAIIKGLI